jgi:hypothetical protein
MNSYGALDCQRRVDEQQVVEKDLLVGEVFVVAVQPHLIASAGDILFMRQVSEMKFESAIVPEGLWV